MGNAISFFIHTLADVEPGAVVGDDTKIWRWTHVMMGATIGRACVVGQGCFIASTATIGDGVRLQNHVSVFDGVTLANDVFCGPSVTFTNVNRPRAFVNQSAAYERTFVDIGATIGANTTIVCGVTIGSYAFIGAGSVVTTAVKPHACVVGNPAKQIGWVCRCGLALDDALSCTCGRRFRKTDDGINEHSAE